MKRTRKLLATVLSLVMILTALPLTAITSFAETSGDFVYYLLDDGTAEIDYYSGSATELTIPSEIDGYTVTSINAWTFDGNILLESVTIPDSVTSIGYGAFSDCTSLTSINVDADNKSYTSADGILFNKDKTEIIRYPIGKKAASFTIPSSVTSIGHSAFYNCASLTSVTIPDSVTSIGDSAFYECTSLASVTIPDSVTSIDYGAFYGCASLASVTIPDSVTSIGGWAFGYYDDSDYNPCKLEEFTIYGYAGSEAERYANDNEFAFVALEKPDPIPDPSPDPDPTPSESIGDVNGDEKLSIVDAKWILQNLASTRDFTDDQKAFADVNGDGKLSVVDAKWILQALAGLRELS